MSSINLETTMVHKIFQIGLFEKCSEDTAECIECKKNKTGKYIFQLSKGSVKSLIVHLGSAIHSESEFAKKYNYLNKTNKEEKIEQFLISENNEISKLDKKVINFICENNLPFNIINKQSFRILFKQTTEKINEESHYRRLLPNIYKIVKKKVLSQLDECLHVSCTTDCWSGVTENFIRFLR